MLLSVKRLLPVSGDRVGCAAIFKPLEGLASASGKNGSVRVRPRKRNYSLSRTRMVIGLPISGPSIGYPVGRNLLNACSGTRLQWKEFTRIRSLPFRKRDRSLLSGTSVSRSGRFDRFLKANTLTILFTELFARFSGHRRTRDR